MVCGERRVKIIAGHYGSGKTEFAVNLALALSDAGNSTALVDLDIINPYFRSREKRELLERHGIRVIASAADCANAHIPALPAEILTVLEDCGICGVVDVGGDDAGARVLARFRPYLQRQPADLFFVLNANRPQTRTVQNALQHLRRIEAASGQKVTGIVNNTHLCSETTPRDIVHGERLAQRLSTECGIPLVCSVAEHRLAEQIGDALMGHLFPIKILMKKPWE